MLSQANKKYKVCAVPFCISTTIKTPEKLFIHGPQTLELRQKWLQLAGRDHTTLSLKYSMHFCEDHFDLPNDMENYMEFKLMGSVGKIRMKRHCLPSKFVCQQDQRKRVSSGVSTPPLTKKQKAMLMCDIETTEIEDLAVPSIIGKTSNVDVAVESLVQPIPTFQSKAVQASPTYLSQYVQVLMKSKYRSKNTQTSNQMSTKATSTEKFTVTSTKATSPIKLRQIKMRQNLLFPIAEESDETPVGSQHCSPSLQSVQYLSSPSVQYPQLKSTSDSSDLEAKNEFELEISAIRLKNKEEELSQIAYQNTLQLIKRKPRFYIGIPEDCLYLVDIIKKNLQISERDILLCLLKIRLDKTFSELGDHFGISVSYASKIFKNCTPLIAGILSHFIIKPKKTYVIEQLPMAFRHKYYKIDCIIDCLEIEIQKPSNAVHQALTWSDYKKANTVKYLISSTPDGIINYISPGFPGRTSDVALTEKCDFLNYIEPGSYILADRGFKHIEQLLLQKGFHLVRPPSVSSTSKMSKAEARKTKQVASLRIHIERVIRRLREFSMLKPHSVVNSNLVTYLDECVVIACALINTQGSIIK